MPRLKLSLSKLFQAWIPVLAMIVLIYSLIPYGSKLSLFLYKNLGSGKNISMILEAFAALIGFGLVLRLYQKKMIRSVWNWAFFILVAGGYIYEFSILTVPLERMHFLEYGTLGLLFLRALRFYTPFPGHTFFYAMGLGYLIGLGEETIQWFHPARVGEFHDVQINAYAVVLPLIAVWGGIELGTIKTKLYPCLFPKLSRFFIFLLILSALFIQLTLQKAEFGYVIHDPGLAVFRTRLDKAQGLRAEDRRRALDAGRILSLPIASKKSYGAFLRKYNGRSDPFLHEMRVHLYRRDKYLSKKKKKDGFFVARKENMILEKYFGHSLHASPYLWSPDILDHVRGETKGRGKEFYESPVSKDIITSLVPVHWYISGFLILLLLMIGEIIGLQNKMDIQNKRK